MPYIRSCIATHHAIYYFSRAKPNGGVFMYFLKESKISLIISALTFIVLGLVLCIWPNVAMNFICVVAGAALLIGGAWQIIAYLRGKAAAGLAPGSFVSGVFEMLFGLVLVLQPQVVQVAVPLLLSVLLLVDSIVKLQISIDLKRAGYGHWWQSLLASLVIGVAAFLFILDPISSAASIVILIGVAFLINGVSDLWITLYVSRKIRDLLEK